MRNLILVTLTLGLLACLAAAQSTPTQPATPQTSSQAPATPAAQPAAGTPAAKTLQAKTKEEFDAFHTAFNEQDLAKAEVDANDFQKKFPDSEIGFMLYQNLMRRYRAANNADKALDMARQVLKLDSDNPEALVTSATIIAETTKPSDLDKDEKYAEAIRNAKHAVEVIPTAVRVPTAATPEQIAAYKKSLNVWAYSALGAISMAKEEWPTAEQNLREACDLSKDQPDAIMLYRLGLTLDKENKYREALDAVTQADKLAANTPFAAQIQQEKQRLEQLTANAPKQ